MSALRWLYDHQAAVATALWLTSEVLAAIPRVRANSAGQALIMVLRALARR